ncbi:Oligopeptide-binding protein AppA [Streptomyces avidinii]
MKDRSERAVVPLVAAVALAVAVTACSAPGGKSASGSAGAGGGAVVVGIAKDPATLSPLLGYGKGGNSKIFDGLLTHDAGMNLKPALATGLPKVTDGGLTYTYELRSGVKFSDGVPFTAKDVVFTYDTILDKKTNDASKSELDAIENVEAKGAGEVVFHLKYSYAPFAERTVLPIVPEHVVSGQDVNAGNFTTHPIGTGPYVLTGWSKGEKLTFKANPHYWGGAPKVKDFTMAVIADDDVRATRLRSGDLDGAVLPADLAATFKNDGTKKTYQADTFDYRMVSLPSANEVAGDASVRRALDIAVDRKAMVDGILDGAGKEAYGPVPTGGKWFAKGTELTHDLPAARRILDEAGWKPGADGIREKDGRRAAFTLWYPSGDTLRQKFALAYASDARKAGIQVDVQAGTWEVIATRRKNDATLGGNGNPADPDFVQYPLLYSKLAGIGLNNTGGYDNPAVDAALDAGRTEHDPAARKAAYDTVQRELAKDPGYTFLAYIDHVYVVDDAFDGVSTQTEPHDHGMAAGPWWNVQDWRPKK